MYCHLSKSLSTIAFFTLIQPTSPLLIDTEVLVLTKRIGQRVAHQHFRQALFTALYSHRTRTQLFRISHSICESVRPPFPPQLPTNHNPYLYFSYIYIYHTTHPFPNNPRHLNSAWQRDFVQQCRRRDKKPKESMINSSTLILSILPMIQSSSALFQSAKAIGTPQGRMHLATSLV
jgi:hypothetical protein